MIIVVLTDCPPKLRGDLSKWLFEINTGVYVGQVSSRVRDELWNRICESISHGQATMVYPATGEQRLEFRVHNTSWEVVDYDGIKLMRRPLSHTTAQIALDNADTIYLNSKAAAYQRSRRIQNAHRKKEHCADYTVLDLETTGLSHLNDYIIEIAALRIRNESVSEKFHSLVQCPVSLSPSISKLTGLSDLQLNIEGQPIHDVLQQCIRFIGSDLLIMHHAAFDYGFLQAGCKKIGLQAPKNQSIDTMKLARQKLPHLNSFSLEAVSTYFGFNTTGCHRALNDCKLTLGIYQKLKEI